MYGTKIVGVDHRRRRQHALGVAALNVDEPAKASLLLNPSAADLIGKPPPDLLVLSKVDLYDNTGALRDYLKQKGYEQWRVLPAFTFWRK